MNMQVVSVCAPGAIPFTQWTLFNRIADNRIADRISHFVESK